MCFSSASSGWLGWLMTNGKGDKNGFHLPMHANTQARKGTNSNAIQCKRTDFIMIQNVRFEMQHCFSAWYIDTLCGAFSSRGNIFYNTIFEYYGHPKC